MKTTEGKDSFAARGEFLQDYRSLFTDLASFEGFTLRVDSLLNTAKQEEYQRCMNVLNRDHSKCIIPSSCIGYGNALSDLENNPPQGELVDKG